MYDDMNLCRECYVSNVFNDKLRAAYEAGEIEFSFDEEDTCEICGEIQPIVVGFGSPEG